MPMFVSPTNRHGQGINFSILSPTIHHLADAYGTNLEGISVVFTSRSAGYLIGALCGCLLFRFMNRELCLSLMYMVIAGALLLLVVMHSLTLAIVVMAIQGFCTGVCDSATNVIVCQTWKQKASPFIQSLYFFFALGNTIASLMTAPLIFYGNIRLPYYITCSVLFAAGAALLPLAVCARRARGPDQELRERAVLATTTPALESGVQRRTGVKQAVEWWSHRQNYTLVFAVFMLTAMITWYSGMEIIYWEFITAYLMSIPSLHILPQPASYMTAAVNYSFTIFRGLAIFFVWSIKPQVILISNFVLLMSACGLLLYSESMTAVWIGNLAIGAAFSTVYPQIYAFAASRIQITNFIGSLFVFASGVTAVFYPQLVAREIQKDHNFLIWLVLISVVVTLSVFLILLIVPGTSNRIINAREDRYEHESHVTRL